MRITHKDITASQEVISKTNNFKNHGHREVSITQANTEETESSLNTVWLISKVRPAVTALQVPQVNGRSHSY